MKLLQTTSKPNIQLVILISAIVFSIVAYLYFLNMSVVHVVMRKEADQETAQLRADIAILEHQFIAAKHTIATRVATLEGFDREVDKIFVTRPASANLAQNN